MEETDLMNNPNLFGHGCVLSAHGIGFEPKLFLEETTFPPGIVLGFGKLGFPEEFKKQALEKDGPEAAGFFDAKFLALEVSKSGVNSVQHEEAIEFLTRYRDEVLRLSRFSNVEQINLRCVVAKGESFAERHPEKLVELGEACGLTMLM